MSTYREQTLQAKAVREGIVEQRPERSRNARPRPVIVEHRRNPNSPFPWVKDWSKWGAYRTEAEAAAAMANAERKYTFYQFRIKPGAA